MKHKLPCTTLQITKTEMKHVITVARDVRRRCWWCITLENTRVLPFFFENRIRKNGVNVHPVQKYMPPRLLLLLLLMHLQKTTEQALVCCPDSGSSAFLRGILVVFLSTRTFKNVEFNCNQFCVLVHRRLRLEGWQRQKQKAWRRSSESCPWVRDTVITARTLLWCRMVYPCDSIFMPVFFRVVQSWLINASDQGSGSLWRETRSLLVHFEALMSM